MMTLHFLRPWWGLLLIPLGWLGYLLRHQTPALKAWLAICDEHLLSHLLLRTQQVKRWLPLICLLSSASCIIISLMGPTWSRLPTPTYHQILPRVVLLDMSEDMLNTDLSPNRLSRAKFKLHDLLQSFDIGQLGLIAYTAQPFVVAPLTEDGQTLDALLTALTPDVMPVGGQRLDRALEKSTTLLSQSGYKQGQILVLTSTVPTTEAVTQARHLAAQGMQVSVLPLTADVNANAYFAPLARAGRGRVLAYDDTSQDIQAWLALARQQKFTANRQDFPVWQDQGRWFIIPALLLLSPAFRRGWLYRVGA